MKHLHRHIHSTTVVVSLDFNTQSRAAFTELEAETEQRWLILILYSSGKLFFYVLIQSFSFDNIWGISEYLDAPDALSLISASVFIVLFSLSHVTKKKKKIHRGLCPWPVQLYFPVSFPGFLKRCCDWLAQIMLTVNYIVDDHSAHTKCNGESKAFIEGVWSLGCSHWLVGVHHLYHLSQH